MHFLLFILEMSSLKHPLPRLPLLLSPHNLLKQLCAGTRTHPEAPLHPHPSTAVSTPLHIPGSVPLPCSDDPHLQIVPALFFDCALGCVFGLVAGGEGVGALGCGKLFAKGQVISLSATFLWGLLIFCEHPIKIFPRSLRVKLRNAHRSTLLHLPWLYKDLIPSLFPYH